MSIWCSWPSVGHDHFGDEGPLRGGEVRTYAEGFSNHYPTTGDTHELPACVDLAHIAPWCVPGHGQEQVDNAWTCPGCGVEHDHPEVGPWLRLGITAERSLTYWHKEGVEGPHEAGGLNADVVLDEAAVLQLYHDLGDWLMLPKVHPIEKESA